MNDQNENWHTVETFKSLQHYGSGALRFVLVVNGASAIGLLTFLGNVATKEGTGLDMRWPMFMFLLGVLSGGIATLTAYLTQLSLYNESIGNPILSWRGNHIVWLYATLFLVLIGVLCFFLGAMLGVWRLQ